MAGTVSIRRRRAGKLAAARTVSREETLRSRVLAGLDLHLDDISGPVLFGLAATVLQ